MSRELDSNLLWTGDDSRRYVGDMNTVRRRSTDRVFASTPSGALAPTLVEELGIDLAASAWQDEAACTEVDTDVFYDENTAARAAARRICRGCPVRQQCLDAALDRNERHGVWGGVGPGERRRLRAERRTRRAARGTT